MIDLRSVACVLQCMSGQAKSCQHSWSVNPTNPVHVDESCDVMKAVYTRTQYRHTKARCSVKHCMKKSCAYALETQTCHHAQRYNLTSGMRCIWYEMHLDSKRGLTAQAISVVEEIPWVVEVGTSHHGVLHMLVHTVQGIQDCTHTALSVCSAAFIGCGLGDHSHSAKLSHLKSESQRCAQLLC